MAQRSYPILNKTGNSMYWDSCWNNPISYNNFFKKEVFIKKFINLFFKTRVSRSLIFLKNTRISLFYRELAFFKPKRQNLDTYNNFYIDKMFCRNKPLFLSKLWLLNYSNYVILFIFFYKPIISKNKKIKRSFIKKRKTKVRFFKKRGNPLSFFSSKSPSMLDFSKTLKRLMRKKRRRCARRNRYKTKRRAYLYKFKLFFKKSLKRLASRNIKRSLKKNDSLKKHLNFIQDSKYLRNHYFKIKKLINGRKKIKRLMKYYTLKPKGKIFSNIHPLRDLYFFKKSLKLFKIKVRKFRFKKKLRLKRFFKKSYYSRL